MKPDQSPERAASPSGRPDRAPSRPPAAPGEGWDAVLFDLDGTLADTVPLILASYRAMIRQHRSHEPDDDLWRRHIGRPLRDSLRHFARDDDELEVLRTTYVGVQRELHDRMVRPFPGLPEIVVGLGGKGVPLALVTSKARPAALRTLRICRLEDRFPVVITADEVTRGKPDPEPVNLALRLLGAEAKPIRPHRTLFVGDSPHDLEAGRTAGVVTVAVTWGAFAKADLAGLGPDHVVDGPEGLARILEGGGGG